MIIVKAKEAESLRRKELEDSLNDRMERGDEVGARVLKQIMPAEQTKEVMRKLRMMKDSNDSQLNHIQVPADEFADPKETDDWITVTDPVAIEEHLLRRNKSHFGQALGTFPTVPPFTELVDWCASTLESDQLLEGEFDTTQITGVGRILMEKLKATTDLNSMSAGITEEDWAGKFRVWNENTSTSPSGMHLSHHKCLVCKCKDESDDDDDETEDDTD